MSNPSGSTAAGTVRDLDVAIVGAGFSGLYMLHRIRDVLKLKARVLEAGHWLSIASSSGQCQSA